MFYASGARASLSISFGFFLFFSRRPFSRATDTVIIIIFENLYETRAQVNQFAAGRSRCCCTVKELYLYIYIVYYIVTSVVIIFSSERFRVDFNTCHKINLTNTLTTVAVVHRSRRTAAHGLQWLYQIIISVRYNIVCALMYAHATREEILSTDGPAATAVCDRRDGVCFERSFIFLLRNPLSIISIKYSKPIGNHRRPRRDRYLVKSRICLHKKRISVF